MISSWDENISCALQIAENRIQFEINLGESLQRACAHEVITCFNSENNILSETVCMIARLLFSVRMLIKLGMIKARYVIIPRANLFL